MNTHANFKFDLGKMCFDFKIAELLELTFGLIKFNYRDTSY